MFDRLIFLVVRDAIQNQMPAAGDRLAVERAGREAGFGLIAGAVISSIDPSSHLKRLAGDEHVAGADDRARAKDRLPRP